MSLFLGLSLAFCAVWAVMVQSADPVLVQLLWVNAAVQIGWFVVAAAIPTWRTARMSWVDIAWPFGVAFVGVAILLLGDGLLLRRAVTATVYLLIGLRMGLGAVHMARTTGVIVRHEFPRYVHARERIERAGVADPRPHMVLEVMTQGLANASILALPGFLLATRDAPEVSVFELAGLALWAVAYVVETTADAQKLLFLSRSPPDAVCDVGLWRYSRHPNYFAEWLVWTGLVVAALPAWWSLGATEPPVVWAVAGLGVLGASAMMYTTLVFLTGAVPAEHFSVQKRPGYRAYQARTNRFFPWFPRA